MKKVLLTAVAVFGFMTIQAQEIKYGAKAGLNLATLNGDVEDAKSLIGAHLGGFVEIKINEKFSFQPELLYSMQGAKSEEILWNDGFTVEKINNKFKLGYMNIPLMLKYHVKQGFFVEFGPQVGFLISAKNDYDYTEYYVSDGEVYISESDSEDIKDNLKSIDFGLNFGFGYEFTENVFASARYNVGLSDINDVQGSNVEIQNGVFQFSVGYKF